MSEEIINTPEDDQISSPLSSKFVPLENQNTEDDHNATVADWMEKAENGESVSAAPEWVRKEISSIYIKKTEDLKKEREDLEFQKELQSVRERIGLSAEQFNEQYGSALNEEVETLIDYGLPPRLALKKAIAILGVRSEADKQREKNRFTAIMPPKSRIMNEDDFYLVSVRNFDSLTDFKRKQYMDECVKRFGEVRFE